MPEAEPRTADYLLYTKSAGQYDRVRFSGRAGQWGHKRQVEVLRTLADDWRGRNVLEIGCGTGRITEMLVRWGAKVTATDISGEMLDVARRRLADIRADSVPEFRRMSVFDIDIDVRRYDYVIMVNVFGRLSDAGGAIKGIASRMSGNSHFVFTFPCLTSVLFPFGLLVNARGKSLSRDATSRWYTPKAMRGCCKAAGLDILRFRGNHYVPVPRVLFWTLPFFWGCEKILAKSFPTCCPSVFAVCRRRARRAQRTAIVPTERT